MNIYITTRPNHHVTVNDCNNFNGTKCYDNIDTAYVCNLF